MPLKTGTDENTSFIDENYGAQKVSTFRRAFPQVRNIDCFFRLCMI